MSPFIKCLVAVGMMFLWAATSEQNPVMMYFMTYICLSLDYPTKV